MKGQTIIELKDVHTGAVERYVDNNMMTEAIEDIFKTRGLMARNAFTQTNLVKACLGGILLFDDALTESASNIFPPTNVNMVGNAAIDVTSTDTVTEMGSYNSNESGWQQDGSFLAVYDFNTSQANGTIASVCLTSDVGGYIGFGNGTSNARKSSTLNIYAYGGTRDTAYGMSGYRVVRVDYTASTVDMIATSAFTQNSENFFGTTKKIKIEKYKIPLSKLNLVTTPTSLKKVSEVELDLTDIIQRDDYWNHAVAIDDDGNIYIYRTSITWAASQTLNLIKISNQNVASKVSIINTSGESFNLNAYYYPFSFIFTGYYMCLTHASYSSVYRFDLTDSSSIEIFNVDTDRLAGYASLNRGGYVFTPTKILNVDEGWIKYHNGFASNIHYINIAGHPLMVSTYQDDQINVMIPAIYLASINNLEQAVVKTADKTMKISYRIMF